MAGFLDRFRKEVVSSLFKEEQPDLNSIKIDDRIALGVLLWVVAEADSSFLPQEKEIIKDLLKDKGEIPDNEISIVISSIEKAASERIDLYTFTSEISSDLSYGAKISIIKENFISSR